MNIEENIHKLFIKNNLTLCTAESCTGGALAARLTRIPGASHYFLGSVICYSNLLKINLLDVPPSILETRGAVSGEVVCLMAQKMREIADSDFSLAVTGIAGPGGGSIEKPVGTVWCALARKRHPVLSWKLQLHGTRPNIITQSCDALLYKLLEVVKKTVDISN